VISAEHPAEVDAAGLRNSTPGAAAAGGTHWVMGGVFHQPHPLAFHDQVHQAGRLLLLTGDLQAYWSGVRTGATTSFAQLFPDGAWAAWVPLLLHLDPDGVDLTGLTTGEQSAPSDCEPALVAAPSPGICAGQSCGTTIRLAEVRSVGERGVPGRPSATGTPGPGNGSVMTDRQAGSAPPSARRGTPAAGSASRSARLAGRPGALSQPSGYLRWRPGRRRSR